MEADRFVDHGDSNAARKSLFKKYKIEEKTIQDTDTSLETLLKIFKLDPGDAQLNELLPNRLEKLKKYDLLLDFYLLKLEQASEEQKLEILEKIASFKHLAGNNSGVLAVQVEIWKHNKDMDVFKEIEESYTASHSWENLAELYGELLVAVEDSKTKLRACRAD
jgi:hypothetical protein